MMYIHTYTCVCVTFISFATMYVLIYLSLYTCLCVYKVREREGVEKRRERESVREKEEREKKE